MPNYLSNCSFLCAAMTLGLLVPGVASAKLSCSNTPTDTSSDENGYITRVVGPGTSTEFDGEGLLKYWDTYVANNVVSRTALLGASWYWIDQNSNNITFAGVVTISINGHAGTSVVLNLDLSVSDEICLPIPTKYLKFAHLAPPGQTPSSSNGYAAYNDISFEVQPGATCTVNGDRITEPGLCMSSLMLDWNSINFDAMAPVIMVHGIRVPANADWFSDFHKPFETAKIPFAVPLFSSKQRIEGGRRDIGPKIIEAAHQFGAKHVHIVAHSKGGLWVRDFLRNGLKDKSTGKDAIGVFSVQTLDTPHHGSVAADIVIAAHNKLTVEFLLGVQPLPVTWIIDKKFYDVSDDDLTPLEVLRYNKRNPHLPAATTVDGKTNKIQYFAYAGDANLNGPVDGLGFGIINCINDPCGLDYPPPSAQWFYTAMQRWLALSFAHSASGAITSLTPFSNSPPYPGNDYVVTVPSAAYSDSFQTMTPTLFVNHTTVGQQSVGTNLMNQIIGGLQSYQ